MPSPRACALVLATAMLAAMTSIGATAGAAPSSDPPTSAGTPTPTAPTATATVSVTTTVTRTLSPSATVTTRTATVTTTAAGPTTAADPSARPATATTATATATVTRAPAPSGGQQTSAAAVGIAIAVLVVAAAGFAYYLRRRAQDGLHTGDRDVSAWDRNLSRMQGTARWFDAQAARLTDADAPRSERERNWADSRPLVIDLERDLVAAGRSAPDADRAARAQALGQAVVALRGAVESGLQDRAESGSAPAPDDVIDARRQLDEALTRPASPPVTPGADPS